MTVSPTSETAIAPELALEYFNPPPTDLPYDDGEPLESKRHRLAMEVLLSSLDRAWSDRQDFYANGNMFVYYSTAQVKNQDFRGPDFFVVLDVDGSKSRKTWAIWEENGRYPDAIVEFMSDSTAKVDTGIKKQIYERTFKTADYIVYDPYDPDSLQGWHLDDNQRYRPIAPNDHGWLWCASLGLWLGLWEGTVQREAATWLRFYDTEGNLVLLPAEAEEIAQQRAEIAQQECDHERQRAERLAEYLRSQGIDPDRLPDT